MYESSKLITGFSTTFRQWKAYSHCSKLHGYALQFKFVFQSESLDVTNWCYDFGNTKWIKDWLADLFDHTTVIAEDDPAIQKFMDLEELGVLKLQILPAVGCEKFAEHIFKQIATIIEISTEKRVSLHSVTCIENENNSATFFN